jgi:hypothetical protein
MTPSRKGSGYGGVGNGHDVWDLSEHVFSSVVRNEDVESYGKRRCLRAFA